MTIQDIDLAISDAFDRMRSAINFNDPVAAQEYVAVIRNLQIIRDDAEDVDVSDEG